jgi:hypothetical protein
MRKLPSLLGLLGVAAATACGSPTFVEPCPAGWLPQESGTLCTPPSSTVDAFTTQLGTGVFGFVRETRDDATTNYKSITSVLMSGETVQIVPSDTPQPAQSSTCVLSPNPIASTVTDDQGVFGLSVPPGQYRLESCTAMTDVTVPDGVIEQDLTFNDVPQ